MSQGHPTRLRELVTREWRVLFALVLAIGLWHGPTLTLAPAVNHDEVMLNVAARNWSKGGPASLSLLADRSPTYADTYYWQPPGQFGVVAVAYKVLGFSISVTRGVSLASAMLLGALTYLALRQLGTARLMAAGLSVLLLTHPLAMWLARSGRPDGFALSAGFAALLWMGALSRIRGHDWVVAGLLVGAGSLFHIMVLSWAPALWAATCWRLRQFAWRGGALMAVCAATPLAIWVTGVFASGNGPDWVEQFWIYQMVQRSGDGVWWNRPIQEIILVASGVRFQPLHAIALLVGIALALWRGRRLPERSMQVGLGVAFCLLSMGTGKGTGMYPLYWLAWGTLAAAAGFAAIPPRAAKVILGVGLLNALVWHGLLQGITWYQREARDPARVEAFFAKHLPRGSVVIGPEEIWYAVEQAGSELRIWVAPSEVSHPYFVTSANVETLIDPEFELVAELPDIMPKVFGRYFSHSSCSYRLWRRSTPRPDPAPH